ncbi:MAG: hypothetical protein IKQ54_11705 [Oscillospiraceae bacterium]|nr:hypothetical protein [Oscillospiraceae bacterium]
MVMKRSDTTNCRKRNIKKRFLYWFDNRMAKGSLGLIRVLIIATVLLALVIAAAIILLGFNEDGETAPVLWDSIATVINAWMPSFEDGSPGYLILMSITAIAGVLFTSVLIGIITSAIEEKIIELKKGNSDVLERDHTVVLGLYSGEYTLLRQLILAEAGKEACIVIGEDMERGEMEQSIKENLEVPKNIKIVCRTVDITDPASIEKCSIETCKTVIISPTEDARTVKAVLAVSALLQEKEAEGIRINAIVAKKEHRVPISLANSHNISTIQTSEILAKMIAHSCTQTGLSETFREVFNFEGSEFNLIDLEGIEGISFEELMLRLDNAVPVGVQRDAKVTVNPPSDYVLSQGDRILVFSEEKDSVSLTAPYLDAEAALPDQAWTNKEDMTDTVIIGYNETLPTILKELPENVAHVFLNNYKLPETEMAEIQRVAESRNLRIQYLQGNPRVEEELLSLANIAEHIVILSDHEKTPEEADMEAIFILLNLRDIRSRYQLAFNITMEMQLERNQNLVGHGDHTDFLVASSMSSLFLAQLAESPESLSVFREILSNEGNELYLKNAKTIRATGRYTVRALRRGLLKQGCILLGYLDGEKHSYFSLPLDSELELSAEDSLIVIGEQ